MPLILAFFPLHLPSTCFFQAPVTVPCRTLLHRWVCSPCTRVPAPALTGALGQAQHALALHPLVAGEGGLLGGSRAPHRDEVAEPGVVHQGVVFAQLHELQGPQVLGNVEIKLLLLWGPRPTTLSRDPGQAIGVGVGGTFEEPPGDSNPAPCSGHLRTGSEQGGWRQTKERGPTPAGPALGDWVSSPSSTEGRP